MKIQCDVCNKDEASVFCCADEAALCDACDRKVHHANKLAGKHQRLSLSSSEQTQPVCDICKEKRGFVFCHEDRAILCWDCDDGIHTSNQLTMKHSRFLLTGAQLSAVALANHDNSSSCNMLIRENQKKTLQNKPITVGQSTVSSGSSCNKLIKENQRKTIQNKPIPAGESVISSGSSSISEYLIKTLPGYRVEDLLVDDADELSKHDEMMPFLECGLGVNALEFPICVPQVPQIQSLNNFISTGVNGLIHCNYKELNQNQQHQYELKRENYKERWSDDSFMVPQISTPMATNNKRPRPSSAWGF